MNGEPKTRYHAEIKLTVEGKEARINVFADTLNEVFSDLAKIAIQYDELHSQARREIMNADLKSKQLKQPKPSKAPREFDPELDEFDTGEVPVCLYCGSAEFMELIRFTDKKTGKPRQAWKCQSCDKWHFPNNG